MAWLKLIFKKNPTPGGALKYSVGRLIETVPPLQPIITTIQTRATIRDIAFIVVSICIHRRWVMAILLPLSGDKITYIIPQTGEAISQKNHDHGFRENSTNNETSSSCIWRIDRLYCWSYGCIWCIRYKRSKKMPYSSWSYRQSTSANPFVVLGGVVLSDHPKPITNTVDTELKTICS